MPVPTLTVSSPTSSSISAKAELEYYAQFGETKPIKGFRFEYQKTGDDTWHYEVPSTSSNSYTYTIDGLEPYTEYSVKTSMILTGAEQLRSFSAPQTLTTKQASAWLSVCVCARQLSNVLTHTHTAATIIKIVHAVVHIIKHRMCYWHVMCEMLSHLKEEDSIPKPSKDSIVLMYVYGSFLCEMLCFLAV